METPPSIPYEIESPLPLQSRGGRVEVRGWLLFGDVCPQPLVRLRVGEQTVDRVAWLPRADVARNFPRHPGAGHAGFRLEGSLPAGVHRAVLEASADGREWIEVRPLSVAVLPSALRAVIERPRAPRIDTDDVRPEGWCFHPDHDLTAVLLLYGNREIACETGIEREDVATLFPGDARARRAGFIAPCNLPPGRGPLRIKAVTADKQVFFVPTGIEVDIPQPEFGAAAAAPARAGLLPRRPARMIEPAGEGGAPLRVLFALYGDFTANSALHVAGLANHLRAAGHECVVAVPQQEKTLRRLATPAFKALDFDDVPDDTAVFAGGARADIVHAWTPREPVRRFCQRLSLATDARRVVHLEDNEDVLTAAALGTTVEGLRGLDEAALAARLPAEVSHPRRAREFLAESDGVTVVVDALRHWTPEAAGAHLVRPAADERFFYPRAPNPAMRAALKLPAGAFVLAYHGNVHAANAGEVHELYAAVARLNARGVPARLIRTGRDFVPYPAELAAAREFVLEVGHVGHVHHLPEVLALADAFVQPGAPGAFNDFRLPSKLPEFFALGRPVILPRTNLGLEVRDGEDALVLPVAEGVAIADAVERLVREPGLAARLAAGAQRFAAEHFSWARSAAALAEYYRGRRARPAR